jgi:hypothetical protein
MNARYILPLIALLALAAASLACGNGTATPAVKTATPEEAEEPEPTAAEGAEPTEEPPPAAATLGPPGLGDVLEMGGYSLCAVAVEDPAEPGLLCELEAGEKLVAVEIIVGNARDDEHSVNPLNATLVDAEGFAYAVELGGRDGQIKTVSLGTGEKARGWVSFVVPEDAVPASLKYEPNWLSDLTLQVGLD